MREVQPSQWIAVGMLIMIGGYYMAERFNALCYEREDKYQREADVWKRRIGEAVDAFEELQWRKSLGRKE